MKRRRILVIVVIGVAAVVLYTVLHLGNRAIILTGIVTTDSVIVSSEIQGRLQELTVKQGETVTNKQLLARIQPQEWKADMAFYANSERQSESQVTQAEADLKYQEAQTTNQIRQAEANFASAESQVTQSEADLENARLNFQRLDDLYHKGVESVQSFDQARTAYDSAKARVESFRKQAQSAQSAVELALSTGDQVAVRQAALAASQHQVAAWGAQKDKASVHLGYTEIQAPIDGVVDVRAALQGEVVNPGQAIVTLINPDDLWIRADVEESFIDRIHMGDKMNVRLPSGAVREGSVFYRSVDADYATQRDVSRSKRDIKTFEIRLRCDNHDRALAVGMTAYVTLRLAK